MSTGHSNDELAQLLDSATTPLPPPDFEQRIIRRLRRQRHQKHVRKGEKSHSATPLNRLLQHASQPSPPPDLAQRVIERLNLCSPRKAAPSAQQPPPTERRYHLLYWARAACLLFATVLACLLRGRPEHATAPDQASEFPSLCQSVVETMTLGEDSMLTEAFNSLDDAEVVAALCAVSTRSSEQQPTTIPTRDTPQNSSR